jgi:hypothetical protein
VTLIPLRETKTMEDRNLPAVIVELVGSQAPSARGLAHAKLRDQEITAGGKTWQMAFRFERQYHPFSVQLVETQHEIYLEPARPGSPRLAFQRTSE